MSVLSFRCQHRYPTGFELDVSFEIAHRFTSLFGPSGSGKTSVLSIIAGLLRPSQAEVRLNGRTLLDTARKISLTPPQRNVGVVFQDALLFPHLTVRDNLQYGRRHRRHPRRTVDFARVVEVLELGALLQRYPRGLSGGEKQRVALGRALLSGPEMLILDEPLAALEAYSRDPALKATAELISGDRLSAVELQCAFLDEVKHHASQGVFQGVVPRFDEIIALWEDTLSKFIRGDLMALAPRLDWVMKLMAIERGMEQRPCLTWESPEVKVIDHVYSSLNDDGLYRAYETSGFTERIVTPERVAHFAANPPADTRAWTRAMLLRRATRDNIEVEGVDWDRITFRIKGRYRWPSYRTLDLADPQGFTKNLAEPIFNSCADFGDLLDGLESLASGAVLTKDAIAVS